MQFLEQLDRRLTSHAWRRMCARGLSLEAVEAALGYGRVVHVRGADIHALGRKEVETSKHNGTDLSRFEGVQVVCVGDGTIVTVYRNHDFRGLRPRRRSHRSWRRP